MLLGPWPPGMRVLRASNPSPMTLDGTRSYVIGRDVVVIVDPGPDESAHLDRLARTVEGATVRGILLTHAHSDHAAGAPRLAARLGAPVMMARGAVTPAPEPLPIGRWLSGSEEVETDVGPVHAVHTPGHVPEHLCYLWSGDAAPSGGALLVGDLLMGEGSTTLIAPPEGDVGAYFESLDRVEEIGAEVLYPAHGPPIEDPRAAVRRFREHRQERLRELRTLLQDTPNASPEALVSRLYGAELDPRLRAAAEGSVRAMLAYLHERAG